MAMIKSFTLGKRKRGLTQEEYLVYLKEKHGPLAAKVIPGLRKYAQNHPIMLAGFESEFDNITEMWWDNVETLQNYLNWRQCEDARVLLEDERKFSDPSRRVRFFAVEHIIVER